jgi:hypothetical protein
VISQAAYVATIEQDLVRILATYDVQVLQEGWVELPLTFGEAAIGRVTAEPGPVWLRGTGNGTYALMFSTKGAHQVTLELTARVRTAPEGRSFELLIPNVGITNFELAIPEADQTIELQPKLLQEKLPVEGATTKLRASLGSTDKVTARWHPRVGTKPDMELLASALNSTLVSVEDGLVHADAYFLVEVMRGQVGQFRIVVPKGQRILDVTSESRVKEWTVAEEENRQVVTVELVSRQSGKIPLEIHTEWPLEGETFDAAGLMDGTAHGIHLLDVLRESGQIAVRTGSDLQLNITTQQGLARIDESEADPRLKRPGAAYFKFYTPECRLRASAKPVEPRVVVEHRADVSLTTDQLRLQATLNYTIERAGLFEAKLKLPEGLTVEAVQCDGLKQYDVSADGTVLTVMLRESRQGALPLTVVLTKPRDPAVQAEDLTIPLLEPLGVEVETGKLRILAPEAIELLTDPATIVGFQPDPTPDASVSGALRLVSAWSFSRRPVGLPAKTLLKPTRLTAAVATTIDVQQGQVKLDALTTFLVEYAGLDTFRVSVPEAIADQVQIQLADNALPPIRQKSRGEAVDGFVPWTIVLQREVTGRVPFRITADLKPTAAGAITETATIGLVRVLDPYVSTEAAPAPRQIPVSRITGEAQVVKDRALSVSATGSGGDVETIDVRELTQLSPTGFVAFRYFQQPVAIAVESSKFEVQEVIETVVSRGLVEVVLDRSGAALFRARFQLKSSERQRLRLDLPRGMEPLGAELDGQAVALEKHPDAKPTDGWEAYLVNVARTKSSDEPFLFAIQYRFTLAPAPYQSRGGSLMLRLPVLGGGDAAVPIQQSRVVIWNPDEFALVGTPEHYEVRTRPTWRELLWERRPLLDTAECEAWIGGGAGGVFDFPTEGHAYLYTNLGGRDRIQVEWWHLPFYTWIVSGALVVIAVILRGTSWENKLTILIVGAFLAAVYALKDPDLVQHGLAVAAYGLAAMVGLWLIHACFRVVKRSSVGTPPAASPPTTPPPVTPPEPPPSALPDAGPASPGAPSLQPG